MTILGDCAGQHALTYIKSKAQRTVLAVRVEQHDDTVLRYRIKGERVTAPASEINRRRSAYC